MKRMREKEKGRERETMEFFFPVPGELRARD